MKKAIIFLVASLLPFAAQAGETAEQNFNSSERQPIVEVIALSQDQIDQLNTVRAKYRSLQNELDEEYEQVVNSIFNNIGQES